MASVIHVPWYATVFRGDKLAEALGEIARVALRYGATDFAVHRSLTDTYRFVQTATFEDKLDLERYWYGEEFTEFRTACSSWYQVPVTYEWYDVVAQGAIQSAPEPEPAQPAD